MEPSEPFGKSTEHGVDYGVRPPVYDTNFRLPGRQLNQVISNT